MTLEDLLKKNNHCTDKHTTHSYIPTYEEILHPFKNQNISLLEIGNNYGGSIRLWDDYFTNVNIIGIEINNLEELNKLNEKNNINIHTKTDAYCLETLEKIRQEGPFDVIIDDGSHLLNHQMFAASYYSKLLKPNGVFVIEDIQNFEHTEIIVSALPRQLRDLAQIIDLRKNKNRFDDTLIVVNNQE
jgi:cephalosporin hydroxylase